MGGLGCGATVEPAGLLTRPTCIAFVPRKESLGVLLSAIPSQLLLSPPLLANFIFLLLLLPTLPSDQFKFGVPPPNPLVLSLALCQ